MQTALRRMIDRSIDQMYEMNDANRFLEVTYASGDKEVLYFKDFNSGAMIENIISRAKKEAIKRFLQSGEKGIKSEDLVVAARAEFKENEDLPNTTNPDDWARISGKKGERIVYVRTLLGDGGEDGRQVERVSAGQYL
jgi:proteasome-associated ATPase